MSRRPVGVVMDTLTILVIVLIVLVILVVVKRL
jgi:hypothetical protein